MSAIDNMTKERARNVRAVVIEWLNKPGESLESAAKQALLMIPESTWEEALEFTTNILDEFMANGKMLHFARGPHARKIPQKDVTIDKVEELKRSDLVYPNLEQHEDFQVSVKEIVGAVAMWAIRQSPYPVPDNLEIVCSKLYAALYKAAEANYNLPVTHEYAPIKFRDVNHLKNVIRNYLRDIPEYLAWNERKNGNQEPFNFTSAYDGPRNPDDDFIDMDALERNVATLLAQHSRLDRNFDELFDQENKTII